MRFVLAVCFSLTVIFSCYGMAQAFENIGHSQTTFCDVNKILPNNKKNWPFFYYKIIDKPYPMDEKNRSIVRKALLSLGNFFYNKQRPDFLKARACYLKIASQFRDKQAEFRLGILAFQGLGYHKNREEAIYWFQKSMEDGCLLAEINLSEAVIEAGDPVYGLALLMHAYPKATLKEKQIILHLEDKILSSVTNSDWVMAIAIKKILNKKGY